MSASTPHQEIRALACRYAQSVDRRDWAQLAGLFTEDAVIEGPGFTLPGRDAILAGMRPLDQYRATQHHVHNQLVEVDGAAATAETYCIANHVYTRDGVDRKLDWGVRYQDSLVLHDGRWLFTRRTILLDWTQDLPLQG